jgi:NAD dependent epimerase/dehydratase family enzyme
VFLGVGRESVTNRKFSEALAKKMNCPYFLPPIPKIFLYMIIGSKAKLALMSTRCSSSFWQNEGFKYEFPELENALNDLIHDS